ncbi:hypothetical protein NQZ68_031184 [Dissostichus eleginoides]|nr:hypothetical protein NQZ68_031184 [Dissostichus eleginoides]
MPFNGNSFALSVVLKHGPSEATVELNTTSPAAAHSPQVGLKMQRSFGIFCVSLIFCAALSETIGLVLAAKEKRGWTLNSAGYLLGPHGIDGHRTLVDKAGLAGKRDMEEAYRTGAQRIADGDIIHTVIDFLSYLKLKEMGALDSLPSSLTSDELANP